MFESNFIVHVKLKSEIELVKVLQNDKHILFVKLFMRCFNETFRLFDVINHSPKFSEFRILFFFVTTQSGIAELKCVRMHKTI